MAINRYKNTIGASGTQIFNGIINAEDYNRQLSGTQLRRNIEVMRRSDTTVAMIIKMVTRPLMGLVWDIEPAKDKDGKSSDEDIRRAEARKKDLFDNPYFTWHSFLQQAYTYLPFGFAVFELTAEQRKINGEDHIGTREIGYRKQTTIEAWQTDKGQVGVKQMLQGFTPGSKNPTGATYAYIPMDKLVVLTHQREGDNYEGISMLRAAYKDWDMKDKLQLILAVGLEKQAIPTPILTVPQEKALSNMTEDPDIKKAIELLGNIRANEEQFMLLPAGWELNNFDMSNQTTKEILPAIQYFDRQMQMLILAPFMDMGSTNASGSKAAGEVQYKPYMFELESIATEFQNTIQTQWINRLEELEYSDSPNGYSRLVHSKIQDDDLAGLADYVQKLSNASLITPNFDTEQHLRKLAHLPELSNDDKARYEEQQKQKDELAKRALENPTDPKGNPINPNDTKGATPAKANDKTAKGNPNDDKPTQKNADAALERLRAANRAANRVAMDIFVQPQGQ